MAARECLEFAGACFLIATLRVLPYRLSIRVAEAAGLAVGSAVPKWTEVAEDNLRDRMRIRKGVYRNLGRVAFALAKLPIWSAPKMAKHIGFDGLEHYRAAVAKGRGTLLLTAHLGNWELGAIAHGAVVGPLHVMVRPIANGHVDRLVESLRRSHGNQVIA